MYTIEVTDAATDETREVVQPGEWADWLCDDWTDGPEACDCLRARYFAAARLDLEFVPVLCGFRRFSVRILSADGATLFTDAADE